MGNCCSSEEKATSPAGTRDLEKDKYKAQAQKAPDVAGTAETKPVTSPHTPPAAAAATTTTTAAADTTAPTAAAATTTTPGDKPTTTHSPVAAAPEQQQPKVATPTQQQQPDEKDTDEWGNALITRIWNKAMEHDNFGDTFYDEFFKASASLHDALFSGTDMKAQAKSVIKMVAAALSLLGEPEQLTEVLRLLGVRHAGYGAEPHHYDLIEPCMARALQRILGDEIDEHVAKHWHRIYSFVASVMIEGAASDEAVGYRRKFVKQRGTEFKPLLTQVLSKTFQKQAELFVSKWLDDTVRPTKSTNKSSTVVSAAKARAVENVSAALKKEFGTMVSSGESPAFIAYVADQCVPSLLVWRRVVMHPDVPDEEVRRDLMAAFEKLFQNSLGSEASKHDWAVIAWYMNMFSEAVRSGFDKVAKLPSDAPQKQFIESAISEINLINSPAQVDAHASDAADEAWGNALVTRLWKQASEHENFGDVFYEEFFHASASLKEAFFADTDMQAQAKSVVQMVGAALSLLDQPDQLVAALTALGVKHAAYGAEEHHYKLIEPCMARALRRVIGEEVNDDFVRHWHRLYTFVSKTMIDASNSPEAKGYARKFVKQRSTQFQDILERSMEKEFGGDVQKFCKRCVQEISESKGNTDDIIDRAAEALGEAITTHFKAMLASGDSSDFTGPLREKVSPLIFAWIKACLPGQSVSFAREQLQTKMEKLLVKGAFPVSKADFSVISWYVNMVSEALRDGLETCESEGKGTSLPGTAS